jgi:hypothetical protein
LEKVESTFIRNFTHSNHKKGRELLRPKMKRQRHRITFFTGKWYKTMLFKIMMMWLIGLIMMLINSYFHISCRFLLWFLCCSTSCYNIKNSISTFNGQKSRNILHGKYFPIIQVTLFFRTFFSFLLYMLRLTYLRLSTGIRTCETVCESLWR